MGRSLRQTITGQSTPTAPNHQIPRSVNLPSSMSSSTPLSVQKAVESPFDRLVLKSPVVARKQSVYATVYKPEPKFNARRPFAPTARINSPVALELQRRKRNQKLLRGIGL